MEQKVIEGIEQDKMYANKIVAIKEMNIYNQITMYLTMHFFLILASYYSYYIEKTWLDNFRYILII